MFEQVDSKNYGVTQPPPLSPRLAIMVAMSFHSGAMSSRLSTNEYRPTKSLLRSSSWYAINCLLSAATDFHPSVVGLQCSCAQQLHDAYALKVRWHSASAELRIVPYLQEHQSKQLASVVAMWNLLRSPVSRKHPWQPE